MKPETAYGILQSYNRIRRGEIDEPQPTPQEVGEAIDVACKYLLEYKDVIECYVDRFGDIYTYHDEPVMGELFIVPDEPPKFK